MIILTSTMSATAAASADCTASAIEKPQYTPLALNARVSGLVVASFHVDAAGAPHEILIEGPKLLTPPGRRLDQAYNVPHRVPQPES
jgi:hypothetical protein